MSSGFITTVKDNATVVDCNNKMNTNAYPQHRGSDLRKVTNDKSLRQRRKYNNRKNRKEKKRNDKFSITMSTWAENFTRASNWQIKHELAYWKARAKALEYENKFLHDIIRKNHLGTSYTQEQDSVQEADDAVEEVENAVGEENASQKEQECPEYEEDDGEENEECTDQEDDEFIVSEEYIEFVKANAKYKEDARRERERFKQQSIVEKEEEQKVDSTMTIEQRKELYGDKWQRICALEMSLEADFINNKDEYKPMYWPNIPFNL